MMNKIIISISLIAVTVLSASNGNDRIKLSDVKVLQFNVGEMAVNTRTPEDIPRVTCAYNPLGDDNALPRSILCKNKGTDDTGSIIWKCEGKMNKALEFDNIQVSCEGYDYPGDEFIRKGSCALTYTLRTTGGNAAPQQPRQTPPPPPPPAGYHYQQPRNIPVQNHHEHYRLQEAPASSLWSFSNVLILVLVVVLVVRCCCKKKQSTPMTGTVNENTNENDGSYGAPSAPPYDSEDSSMSKRTGYAQTVSR